MDYFIARILGIYKWKNCPLRASERISQMFPVSCSMIFCFLFSRYTDSWAHFRLASFKFISKPSICSILANRNQNFHQYYAIYLRKITTVTKKKKPKKKVIISSSSWTISMLCGCKFYLPSVSIHSPSASVPHTCKWLCSATKAQRQITTKIEMQKASTNSESQRQTLLSFVYFFLICLPLSLFLGV